MSAVYNKNTIFDGDVYVAIGNDTDLFGWGDLTINRNTLVNGTTESASVTSGALVVAGGAGIKGDIRLGGSLWVTQETRLQGDTWMASNCNVSGGGVFNVQIGGAGTIASSGGSVSLISSTGNVILGSSTNASDAIAIRASNPNGGVTIASGNAAGGVFIDSAAGGISAVCTGGNINWDVVNGSILCNVIGASGGFHVTSNGVGADSVNLFTSGTSGDILLNNNSSGAGGIHLHSGSGGVCVSGGSLNVGTHSVSISSSIGSVELTGKAGVTITSSTQSSTDISTYGAQSYLRNWTMTDGNDLNIVLEGTTNSKINIQSNSPSANAILLNSTGGGVVVNAASSIKLDSVGDVRINTESGCPVYIGAPNSSTVVYGNLDIRGTMCTIESTVVTIADNIILLNSAPSGISDGGVAIARYQVSNNGGTGDIVSIANTTVASGFVPIGGYSDANSFTLDPTSSTQDDYYNGYWVKVYTGTGALQVRQITGYNGSTRLAQVSVPFVTTLDQTSGYYLYNDNIILGVWDTSAGEYAFASTTVSPLNTQAEINRYLPIHAKSLRCESVVIDTMNGLVADTVIYVTLNNTGSTPVDIPLPNGASFGVYTLMIRPSTVDTGCLGAFQIARVNVSGYAGRVNRTITAKGISGEEIAVDWPSGGVSPRLYYRPAPTAGVGLTVYAIRISTV